MFFDVWRNADRFEGCSQVASWILGIGRFKALTALRNRRDQSVDQTVMETIAEEADDPEAALQKKNEGAMLRACIKQLSVEHREVIDLVYYHEMTVTEVADVLRIPRNTVKTRMFYARKKVSELYLQAPGRSACHA